MRKLKRGVGNWVDGESFWGREAELAAFAEYLDEGAHIYLTAPRRIGKTSLLHEAGRRLGQRYAWLIVDLESARSCDDVVVALTVATRPHNSIFLRATEVFRNAWSALSEHVETIAIDDLTIKLRAAVAGDWRVKATRLFETLAAADEEIVICLDELPILVNRLLKGDDFDITPERREQVDVLMHWLRDMSGRHRGRIRLVLSGSIGLEPVLHQANLSAVLSTFKPFPLGAWDTATAIECLLALAREYRLEFDDGVPHRMVELLGCAIPHHVQVFFDLVREDARRNDLSSASFEDVQRIYDTKMLGSHGHVELVHLEERLLMVLSKAQQRLALDILTEAAVSGSVGLASALVLAGEHLPPEAELRDAVRQVVDVLEHDGYLQPKSSDGTEYRFVSNYVRDWWRKRHGGFHQPVANRGRS
ncbi:MAG: ATP-binding protein [Deltaproteobacteria bacterium]|nr:ATP-binding protein [Deltaproteobacteria bacterium]